METVFDKILKKEIDVEVVYEDSDVLCFQDIHPQAPVHWLVIPKKKVAYFSELSTWDDREVGRLFKKASWIARDRGLNEQGFRVVVNEGLSGGQTVFYLHLHILSGRNLTWPPG